MESWTVPKSVHRVYGGMLCLWTGIGYTAFRSRHIGIADIRNKPMALGNIAGNAGFLFCVVAPIYINKV